MTKEIAIRVNGVCKDFKLPHQRKNSIKSVFTSLFESRNNQKIETQHALKNISFEVEKGDFFGIVGRNGSGKSTLLKILAGIYQPTKGNVQVAGKLVPFIELGVGFNPELTGRENVYLNGALLGFDRNQIDGMYQDIVDFAEIERFMDQKLKNYSSGMQVRLAFSMAIRAEADILLIDEVLAVGDSDFQTKCYDYFKALKRNKQTVVFISHDLDAVEEFCNKVALISDSKLVAVGNPTDTIMRYRSLMAAHEKPAEESAEGHQGTGEIDITEVIVLQGGKPVVQISEGTTFEVCLKFHAKKQINNPVFGLAVVDSRDTIVGGPHTQEAGINLGIIEGEGRVTATFKSSKLNRGMYRIMASSFNEDLSAPYDFIENAAQLEIVGKKRYGIVDLSPEWTVKHRPGK